MKCGIEAKAEELGYTVTTQGPQKFDPTLQKPIVDSVTASKPAALLVAPTDVQAMQAPLQQAAAAGIKVVLVDTTVNDPSFAVSQISSDNVGGGKAAFDAIKAAKPSGGKVLVISTDPGVSTVDARVKGFEDAAEADSTFNYLGVQYSHNDPATAANLVSAALQKDPDIIGIFATNLFSAEGSATGVRQAGAKDVTIVGFDAGPNQIKALEDGTVQALVAQQPATIGDGRRRAGRRGAHRRHRRGRDPDRLHHHHQGQPVRRGRSGRLQVDLLSGSPDCGAVVSRERPRRPRCHVSGRVPRRR